MGPGSFPTSSSGATALEVPTQPAPSSVAGTAATGSIDLSGGGPGAIGQQITVYGKVFRLQVDGVPALNPGEVGINFPNGPSNAGQILRDTINGAAIGATAVQPNPAAAYVDLTGPASSAGNQAITTDAPGVVVTGMSGGVDPVRGRRTAPFHFPTV